MTDVRGICRYRTDAVRQVEKELAGAPADADADGTVRGLTATFAYGNTLRGAYARWGWQAVATRDADRAIDWFRDRDPDGHGTGTGDG